MADDAAATQTNLEALFRWLLQQDPSTVSFISSAIVFIFGLFVLAYVWSRSIAHNTPTAGEQRSELQDGATVDRIDDNALHDLTNFAIEYILPLGHAQEQLQTAILRRGIANTEVAEFVGQGVMLNYITRDFGEPYTVLCDHFCSSPMQMLPFDLLKKHILQMDKNYCLISNQTHKLSEAVGIDYRTDPELVALWNGLCTRHNMLVKAYKNIKRDPRFAPELYRPGINGPWTKEMPEGA